MPFLRNAWYCAGWAHELSREPIARTLLNESVLFYRKQDSGSAVAIGNRCPHRFAPLHKGKLVGDVIQCPYHGLQFDSNGACVHNPHGDGKIPKAAQVKRYPLEERHGVLWLWMGDEALADTTGIPDFGPFGDPEHYTVVHGYLKIPAHYELMNDNLLDLSHVQYMHPFLSNQSPPLPGFEARFHMRQEGNTVFSNNTLINARLPPIYKLLWKPKIDGGEMRANMRWDPPGNLFLDTGMTYVGRPISEGPSIPTAHLLTPETETSTHYYFATARDCLLNDVALSDALLKGTTDAFANEDEPMIGWCQENMGSTTDLQLLNPVLLSGDAAAVRARRILKGLLAAEQV